MNRRVLNHIFGLMLVLVFLVACGGSEDTPVATSVPPTETSRATPTPGLSPDPNPTPKSESPKTTPSPDTLVPLTEPTPTSSWAFGSREESLPDRLSQAEEAAIAVDHEGVLHAVWWSDVTQSGKRTHPVFYASKAAGAWSETVEISAAANAPAEEVTIKLAIALDNHNTPNVVWSKDNAVFYTRQELDGAWSVAQVVEPATCPKCQPGPPVIAIDKEDRLHLIWIEGRSNLIWSSKDPDGEWSSALEISTGIELVYVTTPAALAVDRDNTLHLVWNQSHDLLYVSRPQDGSWSDPVVISDKASQTPTMVIDSANTIHVVWWASIRSQAEFWHMLKPMGEPWSKRKAIPDSVIRYPNPQSFALALAGDDNLILMWKEANKGGSPPMSYVTKLKGEFWSKTTRVPQTERVGDFSIAGDDNGNVHVVFCSPEVFYVVEPIAAITQPEVAIVDDTPPLGLVEFAISTGLAERGSPAISGNHAVWHEKGEQDWDIVGYDLSRQSELEIVTQEGDQRLPAISDGIVVWQDGRSTTPRIYGYDLAKGREFPVTAQSSPQWHPAISDNIVVFRDWRKTGTCSWGGSMFGPGTYCDWDIWGTNLNTGVEFPVRTERNVQGPPRVSANTVVWAEELEDSGWAIYGYQLGTELQPIQIAITDRPSQAIDGSIVVWEGKRDGRYGLYGYDFRTGREFLISTSGGDPAISGNIVVWVDNRSGDADIYGYDLASGQQFPICAAPGDQEDPAIDGDTVVWLDQRNLHSEIYGATLPSMNAKQTEHVVPVATSVPPATPEVAGQFGGSTYAVAVQGNYAYVGVGPRLVTLDISDPERPAVVGRTAVLPGVVQDVAVAGNHAYATTGEGGLRVINIVDPAVPAEVGFYDTPRWAGDVAVAGSHVYVSDSGGGWAGNLRIINVADPAAPTEVGFFDAHWGTYGVVVAGNYAYVAAGVKGLRIINVADPASPTEVGSYETLGDARHVTVVDNYAYIDSGDDGLHIIDVGDPADPIEDSFYRGARVSGVAVAGEYAYVADGRHGLRIIHVGGRAAPTEIGFYDLGGTYGVVVAGNYAYVAAGAKGLRIVDIADPAAPTEVGSYNTMGHAKSVAVAGNHAYVTDRSSGLCVIDVADPAASTEVGYYHTTEAGFLSIGETYRVAVADDYAYVADDDHGLRIISVANPSTPTEVGIYEQYPLGDEGVAVAGDYVYVAEGSNGLRIINVADPAAPTEMGFYHTLGDAKGVAVAGEYAYVADGFSGLRIINVADPAAPTEMGFYYTLGDAKGVAVAGNYAYVAAGDSGLRIIDVADPSAPTEMGFYDGRNAEDVAVAGDYAFITGWQVVRIINVADPAVPTEAGMYTTQARVTGVAAAGDYVYVAAGDAGLVILRFMGGP